MVMWFAFGNLKGVQKSSQRPTKVHLFQYKQVSGRNGDHERLRMINAFIVCDLVWKVQKSYAENRDSSFNMNMQVE